MKFIELNRLLISEFFCLLIGINTFKFSLFKFVVLKIALHEFDRKVYIVNISIIFFLCRFRCIFETWDIFLAFNVQSASILYWFYNDGPQTIWSTEQNCNKAYKQKFFYVDF